MSTVLTCVVDCSPFRRYVFFLYEQPDEFDRQTFVNASTSVSNWSLSEFAAEVGLGDPLGGSFMMVGPDPGTYLVRKYTVMLIYFAT